jgi:hypothetical protein
MTGMVYVAIAAGARTVPEIASALRVSRFDPALRNAIERLVLTCRITVRNGNLELYDDR